MPIYQFRRKWNRWLTDRAEKGNAYKFDVKGIDFSFVKSGEKM